MHELSLLKGLMRKITETALTHGAQRVVRVRVRLGAMSHMSADHFRDHFEEASRGSVAEGAQLEVEVSTDTSNPDAQNLLLLGIDVEVP